MGPGLRNKTPRNIMAVELVTVAEGVNSTYRPKITETLKRLFLKLEATSNVNFECLLLTAFLKDLFDISKVI